MRNVLAGVVAAAATMGTAAGAGATPPPPPHPPERLAAPEGLPKVLSHEDVRLYRRMFALGKPGKWAKVDALIPKLDNKILLGHVLAQRYLHPTAYHTPFNELRAWLARYHDLPQAPRLHDLALQRRPDGGVRVHRPTYDPASMADLPGSVTEQPDTAFNAPRIGYARSTARYAMNRVQRNVNRTWLSVTEDYLRRDEVRQALNAGELGWARARVAAGWYFYGDDDEARANARKAVQTSDSPYGHWIAGLAAWRQEDLKAAAEHFAAVATTQHAPEGKRAAGAYWAARAHIRLRQPGEMSHWLRRARKHPRTFYGQLAAEALGTGDPLRAQPVDAASGPLRLLRTQPAGRRALALFQVGKRELAKRELRGLPGWDRPETAAAVMLAASRGGLSAYAHDMARHMSAVPEAEWARRAVMAARYPIPPWEPHTGFRMDRALLYGVMRKESSYEPVARSGAGARGLMQLMPATARFVAARNNLRFTEYNFSRPAWNMEVAQRYMRHLSRSGHVKGNLINLLVAYNAGPGNLARWRRTVDHRGDPLLFIESIPSREARRYVERVMRNMWIYRARLGQPAPSRRHLAAGRTPRREPDGDAGQQEIARK